MNLKNLKLNLPKRWQETSRSGTETQTLFWLNHISPLVGINPERFHDKIVSPPNAKVTVVRMGISGSGQVPLQAFYDQMKASIDSGLLPSKYNYQWLDKLWTGMTKAPGLERPGESDFSGDITISQYQNEKIAKQSFKNMGLMTTKGFDVPIPGGTNLPGIPEDITIIELLNSDAYEKYMSKEYLEKYNMPKEQIKKMEKLLSKENLEKMRAGLKEAQKEIPKIRQEMAKSGSQHKERKFLGYPALYLEGKNPTPRPSKTSSYQKSDMITGGGGGFGVLDALPIISRPYQKTLSCCQAILVKNFIIIGSLLWPITSLPSGNTPCYSLTQTRRKTITDSEGWKTTYIMPTVSNYAKEGYFHREEVEEIIKGIIKTLSV